MRLECVWAGDARHRWLLGCKVEDAQRQQLLEDRKHQPVTLDRCIQIQIQAAMQRAKEEGQRLYPAVDRVGEVGGGNIPGNSGGGDTKVAYIFSHFVSQRNTRGCQAASVTESDGVPPALLTLGWSTPAASRKKVSVRNKKRTSRAMLTAKHCIKQIGSITLFHATLLQTFRVSNAYLHHEDEGEATPKNQEHLEAMRL